MIKHYPMRLAPYDIPLLLFLLSAVFSIWPAYNPQLTIKPLVYYAACGLLYLIISRLGRGPRGWQGFALALSVAGVGFAGYYVTQLGHMAGQDKISILTRLAEMIARFTPDLVFFSPLGNSAGTFLEGLIFLVAGLALAERRRIWKVALWLGVALCALALLLSASRGAWLAVIAGALLWASLYWKPARILLLIGLLGLGGLALAVAITGDLGLIDRMPVVGDVLGVLFIRADRLTVYYHSLAMLSEVPFTGIGLGGQFAMAYARYQLYLHVPFLYYSHNLFLEIWLQQGLLGIFSWLWLIISVFRVAWVYRVESRQLHLEAAWIGLAATLVHGLSDARQMESFWCWLPFWGLLGLNAALIASSQASTVRALPRWLPAAAAAVLVAVAWVAAMPLAGAVSLNRGSILHHRAELAPGLTEAQRNHMLDEAKSAFEQSLQQSPDNFGTHHRLGMIALLDGNAAAAVEHLEQAVRARPLHEGARKLLGLAYIHNGDTVQAAVHLSGLLNIVGEMNYYADLYAREGLPNLSLSFYQTSLLLDPNQPAVVKLIKELAQ